MTDQDTTPVVVRVPPSRAVQIEWLRADGQVYTEVHTIPPEAVQQARLQDQALGARLSPNDATDQG